MTDQQEEKQKKKTSMHTSNQKFHQYDMMHNDSTNNTTNAQVHKPRGKKA